MAISRRRPTSADVAARAGVSRTTVSFVLNDRPAPTSARRPGSGSCWPRPSSATTPTPRPGSWPAARATRWASSCASRPSRSPATPPWPRRSAASPTAARSAGFRVMVEPLDPDGGSYEGLLRAQHVDGLVVSGPRVDDAGLARPRPRRLPDRPPGLAAGPRRRQRRHRQRQRRAAGGRAPDRPRPAADRLHHERAARLHGRPGAARRLPRRRSRRPASPTTTDLVAEAAFDAGSGHRAMAGLLARGADRRGVRRERRRRVRGDRRDPRGRPARPRRRVGRRLRRHRPRGVLRPAAHDRPPAGVRPGARGRHARSSTGSPAGRCRTGRCCRPSSSSARRRRPPSSADAPGPGP